MIRSDQISVVREVGTATFANGAIVKYPSREAYHRCPPQSEHTVKWFTICKTEQLKATSEDISRERDAAILLKLAEERIQKAIRQKHNNVIKELNHNNVMQEHKPSTKKADSSNTSKEANDPADWVNAITGDRNKWPTRKAVDKDSSFAFNKVLYFKTQAETLIAQAEKIRGIHMSHRIITLGGVTKTVLFRNALNAKKKLTAQEKQKISNLEFQALWCSSAAAACKIAESFDEPVKRIKFMEQLNKLVDFTITGDEPESGKAIYMRKMQSLFSLLGAFMPNLPDDSEAALKYVSERFEAERDLLAIEKPSEIVATYHLNGNDPNEFVYEIEIPDTKLSDEQKEFFTLAANKTQTNEAIGGLYNFYQHLKPWQQQLIRREAANILQENRLRPSQMQFLPMAPNFWTRYTAVRPKELSVKPTIVNEISRCGALSTRVDASDAGIIQFQKMQYGQIRTNFGLKTDDQLCYTSYKQNFYGLGADDKALKNITKAHEDKNDSQFALDNHIYNIPIGRFSLISRIMNATHNFFFDNKFENNKEDPLIHEAFQAVETLLTPERSCRDYENPLSMNEFLHAEIEFPEGTHLSDLDKKRVEEIKMDLEQIYRKAIEIEQLRYGSYLTFNLRIATLRAALFHDLKLLHSKTKQLPSILYSKTGSKSIKPAFNAYISGCKSNIDRGTLVALHTEVLALKEYKRRQYWNTTFTTPTNLPASLNTKSFAVSMLLSFPIVRSIANFFTTYFYGESLKQLNEKYALDIMRRDVAIIDTRLETLKAMYNTTTPEGKRALEKAQTPLLNKRADLITHAVNANVSIEAAVCQGGHSRIMPSHGGSTNVSGIKDSVVDAVAPNLEEYNDHLTSQDKLSSHNHSLHTKSGIDPKQPWVSQEHRDAAASISTYQPPAYDYINRKDEPSSINYESLLPSDPANNPNPTSRVSHNPL